MEYEGTFWCVIGQMGSLPGEQGRFVSALFLNSQDDAEVKQCNQEAWMHYCDFNIIEKAQAYMRRNED